MRCYLFLLLLFNFPFFTQAQSPGSAKQLAGYWSGELTQNAGGYAAKYFFSLQLRQSGDQLTGIASVTLGDIQAEMQLTARQLSNGSWRFAEQVLLRSKQPEEIEWCLKTYDLRLVKGEDGNWYLKGPWWGNSPSGPCVPGNIILSRPGPRAR